MSDVYQSSDNIKTVSNRQLGANIFEVTVQTGTPTNVSGAHWRAYMSVSLDELNLNTLNPEFEVYMYNYTRVDAPEPGEHIYYNNLDKLPVTRMDLTGAGRGIGQINEAARAYVTYTSSGGVKSGVTYGTAQLNIDYYLYGWNGVTRLPTFYIKIKGSDAITAT